MAESSPRGEGAVSVSAPHFCEGEWTRSGEPEGLVEARGKSRGGRERVRVRGAPSWLPSWPGRRGSPRSWRRRRASPCPCLRAWACRRCRRCRHRATRRRCREPPPPPRRGRGATTARARGSRRRRNRRRARTRRHARSRRGARRARGGAGRRQRRRGRRREHGESDVARRNDGRLSLGPARRKIPKIQTARSYRTLLERKRALGRRNLRGLDDQQLGAVDRAPRRRSRGPAALVRARAPPRPRRERCPPRRCA